MQDGNYTFTTGAIRFQNKVKMHGECTFAYQTSQTSTLAVESQLKLDQGFTFSYDPIIVDSQDLLEFTNKTSVLILNGATLHATTTGMNLTKGKLRVQGESSLASETKLFDDESEYDTGISFGDETVDGDLTCEIMPGAMLNVTAGSLRYKNLSFNSLIMGNDQSLLYLRSGTALRLHQSMSYSQGVVRFAANTTLARAVGKKLLGPVDMQGTVLYKNLPFE